MHAPRFAPGLRRALRLLDGAGARLGTVHSPPTAGDLARGPFSDEAAFHPIPVAICCLAGPLRLAFRGRSLDLAAGDAVVVPAATWYRSHPPRGEALGVGFGWLGNHADCWLFSAHDWFWIRLPLEPQRLLLRRAAAAGPAERQTALRELLLYLVDQELEDLREYPPALGGMLDVVLRRLHRGATTADLVRASGLSRSRAYALFTGFYGLSPRRALELRRLELAEALLAAGCPVAEAARHSGWSRRETFSRAWRRQHGSPPRQRRVFSASSSQRANLVRGSGRQAMPQARRRAPQRAAAG